MKQFNSNRCSPQKTNHTKRNAQFGLLMSRYRHFFSVHTIHAGVEEGVGGAPRCHLRLCSLQGRLERSFPSLGLGGGGQIIGKSPTTFLPGPQLAKSIEKASKVNPASRRAQCEYFAPAQKDEPYPSKCISGENVRHSCC